MRKWRRMTPASIALCIPSPRSMVEGASAALTPQVRTMGVLLPARGLARRRICVPCVRRMMLVEYIQNSPARSLFWRVALLGGDGANESSSAGRAGQGTGAGRGGGVVRGCGRAPVPLVFRAARWRRGGRGQQRRTSTGGHWRVALLGGDGADESSSAGRAGHWRGAWQRRGAWCSQCAGCGRWWRWRCARWCARRAA